MLGTLQNLFYKKGGETLTKSIILLIPSFIFDGVTIFNPIKKSFSNHSTNLYFLIDGTKTNSKKSLLFALNKIHGLFVNSNKKKSPFLLIMITNLENITIENQTVFSKFLAENSIAMRFFFFANDLKYFNKAILSKCTLKTFCESITYKKKLPTTQKIVMEKIIKFPQRKIINNFYLNSKITLNINNLISKLGKNFTDIKRILFMLEKKFTNEIFYLFVHLCAFPIYHNLKSEMSGAYLPTNKSYTNQYQFYITTSFKLKQEKNV